MSATSDAEWVEALKTLKSSMRYDAPNRWLGAYGTLEPYRRRYLRYLGAMFGLSGALVLFLMFVAKLTGPIAMMMTYIPLGLAQWATFKYVPYLRRVQESALAVFYFDEVVANLSSKKSP